MNLAPGDVRHLGIEKGRQRAQDAALGLATQPQQDEVVTREHGVDARRIQLATELESIPLDLDSAVPYGLIFNELLTNALRHAFPDDRPGQIRIALQRLPDQRIRLAVEDDGVGLPTGFDWQAAPSLGFRLVRMLAEQFRATKPRLGVELRACPWWEYREIRNLGPGS